MAKLNPTITAYLVPYLREGYDNKIFGESTSLSRTFLWYYLSCYIEQQVSYNCGIEF